MSSALGGGKGTDSKARQQLLGAPAVGPSTHSTAHIARELPPECPVRPLGMVPGDTPTAAYLTASGTITKLTGQAMGQGNLEALFSPHNRFLWNTWPRLGKEGHITGIRAELARADLLAAAGRLGIWDEMERVRGSGAWQAADGSLVLHLGDRVLTGGKVSAWGEIDGYVYPAQAAMLGPVSDLQPDGIGGPAREVLAMLETWNWKYPIASRLMLGWVCAAMLGGALKWRPAVWPTGDRGTGKSSLVEAVKLLLGPNGAITTTNTTAAGIRQVVMNKSIPVLLDEMEASEDGGDAIGKVVELLRQASSGGIGLRGGSDHKGTVFQIRSAMLAASIVVPPLKSQDRSRIALLELLPLPSNAVAPSMAPAPLHAVGRRLFRRMVQMWPLLPDRLETWRAQLGAHAGMDARGQDQYGTLLACADLALSDAEPDADTLHDTLHDTCFGLLCLVRAHSSDDVPDWRRCIDHMLTAAADAYRGGDRVTLGALVRQAADLVVGGDAEAANRALAAYGMRYVLEKGIRWLAVANQHRQLAAVYDRTIWAARSGTSGGWRQTLLRAPGALPRENSMRFDGAMSRAMMVPLEVALNEEPGRL